MVLLVILCCRMFYSMHYNLTVLFNVAGGVNVNALNQWKRCVVLFPAALFRWIFLSS